MSNIQGTSCCGVGEIYGLYVDATERQTNFDNTIRSVLEYRFANHEHAIYLFTDAVDDGNGVGFRNFIRHNRLGRVVETHKVVNPNSDNYIKAWLWTPNEKNLEKYAKKHKLLPEDEDEDYDY